MKSIKVEYKRMKTNWGLAHFDKHLIEIDASTKGKKRLEILNHEALHLLIPEASEEEIIRISIALTKLLWREGYRQMDNDTSQPLQKINKNKTNE